MPSLPLPPSIPALELTANVCDEASLERWMGEPIKGVVIDTATFITNAKGYPVLSRVHQAYFKRLLKVHDRKNVHAQRPPLPLSPTHQLPPSPLQLRPQVILKGNVSHEDGAQAYLRCVARCTWSAAVALFRPNSTSTVPPPLWRSYLNHLKKAMPALTSYEKFTLGYEDYLEIPLQVGCVSCAPPGRHATLRRWL